MIQDIYKRVTFDEFQNRTETDLSNEQKNEHDRILGSFLTKFGTISKLKYSLKLHE